jgi:hypothetical protein
MEDLLGLLLTRPGEGFEHLVTWLDPTVIRVPGLLYRQPKAWPWPEDFPSESGGASFPTSPPCSEVTRSANGFLRFLLAVMHLRKLLQRLSTGTSATRHKFQRFT